MMLLLMLLLLQVLLLFLTLLFLMIEQCRHSPFLLHVQALSTVAAATLQPTTTKTLLLVLGGRGRLGFGD
jgi:hypothetical protein